jgi:hypothetical protein
MSAVCQLPQVTLCSVSCQGIGVLPAINGVTKSALVDRSTEGASCTEHFERLGHASCGQVYFRTTSDGCDCWWRLLCAGPTAKPGQQRQQRPDFLLDLTVLIPSAGGTAI